MGDIKFVRNNGFEGKWYFTASTTAGSGTHADLIAFSNSDFTYKGNNVWHAGNLTNLNQLTNGPGYITGESDTLATVTARGATSSVEIITTSGFQGRYYRIREASANRGGLYPYNLILGSGTDYGVGIFSEGELYLASGGSATKRFTMNNAGAANFTGNLTAANFSGSSSGTNTGDQTTVSGSAGSLSGYGIDQFRAFSRLNTISMGGNTTTFYPVYFNGDYWGNGVGEIEIVRTSVHQDGSSYGSLMSKIRGRSTAWGHHFDFWESEIYISNGTYHPFIAKALGHSTCGNFLIWLKGGLSYYWRSDSPMSVSDASATSKTISCGGTNTYNTQSTVDGDFTAGYRWYMTGLAARSTAYDLGTSSYRWGTVFGVTGNFSGDVIAYASSDERLKENIKPIQEPVKKTKSISGVEFDWNETLQSIYKGHDIGVIAQEIEKVLPELVTTREDGYKAVKYEKIVALLIEAIKEQQSSIEKLESRIEKLERGSN
jgi:hypothetical protein